MRYLALPIICLLLMSCEKKKCYKCNWEYDSYNRDSLTNTQKESVWECDKNKEEIQQLEKEKNRTLYLSNGERQMTVRVGCNMQKKK